MSDTNGNKALTILALKVLAGLLVTIALGLFTWWGTAVERNTARIGKLEGRTACVEDDVSHLPPSWLQLDMSDVKADVKVLLQKMSRVETLLQRGNACVDSDIPAFEDFGGLVSKSKSSKEREGGAN